MGIFEQFCVKVVVANINYQLVSPFTLLILDQFLITLPFLHYTADRKSFVLPFLPF